MATSLLTFAEAARAVYDKRSGDCTIGNLHYRIEERQRTIRIAFAGSDDVTDWAYNLRFFPRSTPAGLAHGGLVLEARKVYAMLRSRLFAASAQLKIIELTGHSAGGAIAQLVSDMYWAEVGTRIMSSYVRVVTFAAPKIYYSSGVPSCPTTRVEHADDPVPKVAFFLKHRQSEAITLDDSGIIDAFDHSMDKYLHIIARDYA